MAGKGKKGIGAISAALVVLAAVSGALLWKTRADLQPLPDSLALDPVGLHRPQVLDRHGAPLTVTYANPWNLHDRVPLEDIPLFLQQAFVLSEDKRFFRHGGTDRLAQLHALFQNLRALRTVRGASTITEQVVRLWRPRPRTVWSRWIEGIEAARLDRRFSKADILEFYLNQVPYAARRRGVVQAARYYFDRDLDTLSLKEMLALVVLVRAPGRLDLYRDPSLIERPVRRLARRLAGRGLLSPEQAGRIEAGRLEPVPAEWPVYARHFVGQAVRSPSPALTGMPERLRTTLDSALQRRVQAILNARLDDLQGRRVENGAVLVLDHERGEVLAWVNGGAGGEDSPESWIDGVTTPRQPGSTLKPFLYALALEKGWTAATLVEDLPLAEPIGRGLHTYRNYSRTHYGPLRLREALGNSLNIPAVRTAQYVGVEPFLTRLRELGMHSLVRHPDHYGDGLALGNGEVTLLELVRAYAVLARGGLYQPLKWTLEDPLPREPARRIFSPEVSSLVADILADPEARRLEFGQGGLLRLPVETAVKTGTSTDYRDAWALGFNHRYTVGVWTGNLNGRATDGVTGSSGPALVLRSVFAELNRRGETRPLFLSPRLVRREICRDTGTAADGHCPSCSEWFLPGTGPVGQAPQTGRETLPSLRRPSPGLELAMDPRIPDDLEAFCMELSDVPAGSRIEWFVDESEVAVTAAGQYLWPLERGPHAARARVWLPGGSGAVETNAVGFVVR